MGGLNGVKRKCFLKIGHTFLNIEVGGIQPPPPHTYKYFDILSLVSIIHNITAKAALKFGSEAWVLKKREEQRLKAAQMKFLRHLLGITKLDKEKNQCIREETGAQSIAKEIKQYQKKWLHQAQRMDTNRLPRQALKYRIEGRRNIGRPKKKWRNQLHFED